MYTALCTTVIKLLHIYLDLLQVLLTRMRDPLTFETARISYLKNVQYLYERVESHGGTTKESVAKERSAETAREGEDLARPRIVHRTKQRTVVAYRRKRRTVVGTTLHLLFHLRVIQILFQRQSTAFQIPDGLRQKKVAFTIQTFRCLSRGTNLPVDFHVSHISKYSPIYVHHGQIYQKVLIGAYGRLVVSSFLVVGSRTIENDPNNKGNRSLTYSVDNFQEYIVLIGVASTNLYLISRILGQEVRTNIHAIAVLSSAHLAHSIPDGMGVWFGYQCISQTLCRLSIVYAGRSSIMGGIITGRYACIYSSGRRIIMGYVGCGI